MKSEISKPVLGISSCLNGHKVRFDGSHIKSDFVEKIATRYFELNSICPETGMGLSTPRPTIQLRNKNGEVRLVLSKNPEVDFTASMIAYSKLKLDHFNHLDGFIVKSKSPSCGLQRVPVKDDKTGQRLSNGVGMFTGELIKRYPYLPVEEDGRLRDEALRDNFLERVYAHKRWREVNQKGLDVAGLQAFHQRYKLILIAKSSQQATRLGQWVAIANSKNMPQISEQYFSQFMQVMGLIASKGQQVNVLMHIMGYLKNHLDAQDKKDLLGWFQLYRSDRVNHFSTLNVLQNYFRRFPDKYVSQQFYLEPYPQNLNNLN